MPQSPRRSPWPKPPEAVEASPRQRQPLFAPPAGRLCAIVDAEVCAAAGRAPLDVAHAYLNAGARWLQLRCKEMPSGRFLDLANAIQADAAAVGAILIINDRADITAMSGAAGLHVGQADLSPANARSIVGDAAIVGLSTHSREQWDAALAEPISYLAIGPAFGTATKRTGYDPIGLQIVTLASTAASARGLPTVAIGGITLQNAPSVIEAGATSVAVISDLLKGDPESRCRAFLRALE